MGLMEFIQSHFLHALPILILAAIAVAISLERFQTLFYRYSMKEVDEFFAMVADALRRANVEQAVSICDEKIEKPVAQIMKTALSRSHFPEESIQDGIQMCFQRNSQLIMRRTSFLATIANVATLLGLFGTILGLIQAFEAVGHADPQQKSALLSAGIATSMNATMLGLGVAIPCMIAFSYLMNRSNRLVGELEDASVRSLDLLRQRFYEIDPADNVVPIKGKKEVA